MGRARFDVVAAVDLGSNSFHMVVARSEHEQIRIIDRLRERVALAEGLDEHGRIRTKVMERAFECLERFGQRLAHMPRGSVRVVGTNTLRRMADADAWSFVARASRLIGHPVEVISGREEARLIYVGVTHAHADDSGRRLVIDVGGGSTECILGEGLEPLEADSLQMGCVGWTMKHFPDGAITRERMRRAEIAAAVELQAIARRYRRLGWESCIGSSGTIVACEEMLRASGWSSGGIQARGLRRLRRALLDAGHPDRLDLPELQADRAPVLAGGVAILSAAFRILDIDTMHASPGALREGLLHDLLGRMRHEDVRDRSIRAFAVRHAVDAEQAGRVERAALQLLAQARSEWQLEGEERERMLAWAARLHEIGLSVSYSGYHRHGAYLAEHSDLAGFSREDQLLLSILIRNHRRKPDRASFDELPEEAREDALKLCALLRIAVRLHRSRRPRLTSKLRLVVRRRALALEFDKGWLERHPLSRADLDEEASMLRELGFELSTG